MGLVGNSLEFQLNFLASSSIDKTQLVLLFVVVLYLMNGFVTVDMEALQASALWHTYEGTLRGTPLKTLFIKRC